MKNYEHDLTDSEWEAIKNFLPPEHPKAGERGRPPISDNRARINGLVWIARNGSTWRSLPERYGKWQTLYSWFRKCEKDNIFEKILLALVADADTECISIDSTACKVHQSANGGEPAENKAVGVSKGGRNTKVHALVERRGLPLAFQLSPGNEHDCTHAIPLLKEIEIGGSNILGDKAYGTARIREYIQSQGAEYTIPPKSNCKDPWPFDRETYKQRHVIECFFQKLKWFRRIFTRYDKLDKVFLAFVYFASVLVLVSLHK